MRRIECWTCALVFSFFGFGCGSSPDAQSGDSGGAGTQGSGASGGSAGQGNAVGGSSSSGGSSSGGSSSGGAASGGATSTGGTANGGGAGDGGSGGTPQQTVLPCDQLPEPGVWEDITPPELHGDYRSAAFVVDPVNSGVVYIGTDSFDDGNSKGVQKTTDCGASWTHISTGDGSDEINGGRQWTFRINPQDPQILYTNSGYYDLGLWKSTNGGIDWIDVTATTDGAPGFVGDLQIDPDDPDHLIQSWHAPCNGPNGEYGYEDQVGCFHETTDGGATWKGHYSTGTKWPSEVRPLLLHGSTWIVLADEALRTTDGGETFESAFEGSLGGHSSGALSRSLNGDFYIGTAGGVYKSTAASDGAEWVHGGGSWSGEVEDTGTTLFMGQAQATRLQTSPSGDGPNWASLEDGPLECGRVRYDSGHGLLFASCGSNGFWRYVLK
jgi:hypothetical protein